MTHQLIGATMTYRLIEIAKAYWRAAGSRVVDRFLAYFASDAIWSGPGRIVPRGYEEIGTYYASPAVRFPSLSVRVLDFFGSGTEGAIRWDATFKDPSGKSHELTGVNLMRPDGGQIVRLAASIDPAELGRDSMADGLFGGPVGATP